MGKDQRKRGKSIFFKYILENTEKKQKTHKNSTRTQVITPVSLGNKSSWDPVETDASQIPQLFGHDNGGKWAKALKAPPSSQSLSNISLMQLLGESQRNKTKVTMSSVKIPDTQLTCVQNWWEKKKILCSILDVSVTAPLINKLSLKAT